MKTIEKYLHDFVSLKTATVAGKTAPHKAVMLLAIIELVEEGVISDNHIVLSEELVARFGQIWNQYIKTDTPFQQKAVIPYWHLKSEPFYHLFFIDGTPVAEIVNPHSATKLKAIVYASLDNELFELMKTESGREELSTILIINYLEDIAFFDRAEDAKHDCWIISSNASYFHIDDCIREVGHVYWRQHINASVGDRIYLYGTRPECRIKYLMEAKSVSLPFSDNMNDEKYWVDSQNYEISKKFNRFMKLDFIKKIDNPKLSLSELLKHGLKGAPQGPIKISQPSYAKLLDYIRANED